MNPSSDWRSIIEPLSAAEKSRVVSEPDVRGDGRKQSLAFLSRFRYYIPSAQLWDADLRGADLSDSYLVGAHLAGADLQGADLSRSDLSDVGLSGANLAGAKFTNAIVREVHFGTANLTGADFKGAIFDKYTRWPRGFDPVRAGARLVE
jgi:uncharacterized protein YjbI with pentapeptide repeats